MGYSFFYDGTTAAILEPSVVAAPKSASMEVSCVVGDSKRRGGQRWRAP